MCEFLNLINEFWIYDPVNRLRRDKTSQDKLLFLRQKHLQISIKKFPEQISVFLS